MKTYRQKLANELIYFLEGNRARPASWKRTLARLNQQHNRIRAWNLDSKPVTWRLLK